MAQQGAVTATEHRGEALRLLGESRMADRIDPAMDQMQASADGFS